MKKLFVLFLILFNVSAFGLITENSNNGCTGFRSADPVFEKNSYECQSGTYLPADGIACVACPALSTCRGGTFTYNAVTDQGVVNTILDPINQNVATGCSESINNWRAVYEINEYNCAAGTYLPANAIACTTCPANSYCGGGTYEFNETTDQGITACPSYAPTSPAGSSNVNQCIFCNITDRNDTSCYVTDGLILHYDGLNNTGSGNNPNATSWIDLSSQHNDGQFVGTVTYDSTKHGYTFTNNANYVQTLNNIGLTGAVVGTVEIVGTWYGNTGQNNNGLWWFGSTDANDNQSLCGQVNTYANVNNYFTFTAPSTNEVHMWDFISSNGNYNGRSVKVDGTTVATSSSSGGLAITASKMQIGRSWQYSNNNRSFNGVIHAVRVYNRVLTDEEILAHYQLDQMRFNTGITCTSGQYLPKNTTVCASCPNGYTCGGGTYTFNENTDQGIVANTITINWNGALQSDINANDAGTVTYGGDIRTPVRADPAQIPAGKRFVGWVFRKTNN